MSSIEYGISAGLAFAMTRKRKVVNDNYLDG